MEAYMKLVSFGLQVRQIQMGTPSPPISLFCDDNNQSPSDYLVMIYNKKER